MLVRIVLSLLGLATVAIAAPAFADCRSMDDLANIPAGWHPITVRWYGDRPDLVCIERDGAPQMQVSHWRGFGVPAGYYILYTDNSLDTTFRGCAQFSEFQGVKTCMTSWPTSRVARNPKLKRPKGRARR